MIVHGDYAFTMDRGVLSNASIFFHTMWNGSWRDHHVSDRSIHLRELDPAVFSAVATFITDGRCTLSSDELLLPVLRAAHLLQVPPLLAAAEAAVRARLSADNILAAWQVADHLELSELRMACEAIILRSLDEVVLAMAELGTDEDRELLIASCQAIGRICASGVSACYRRRERAAESGALEAVVALMERLPKDDAVQRAGCVALANICEGSKTRKLRAARAGAVAAVAAAQRACAHDEAVQELCSGFLKYRSAGETHTLLPGPPASLADAVPGWVFSRTGRVLADRMATVPHLVGVA